MTIRLKLLITAILVVLVGTFCVPAAQASLAPPRTCTSTTAPTAGRWSMRQAYVMTPGTWCIQNDGRRMVFQSDGNLVVYPLTNNYATWASNTAHRGAHLVFQTDGNLVIYDANHVARWASGADHLRRSGSFYNYVLWLVRDSSTGNHFAEILGINPHLSDDVNQLWRVNT
jgi:hypothetical protein